MHIEIMKKNSHFLSIENLNYLDLLTKVTFSMFT